jgi:hypothetical protein
MLLDIKGTIVNAFIEPQFEEVSSGHLVTVQFSDLDTLGRFKRYMQGDTRIDLTDKYFHFTGYTQLLDLNHHVSGERKLHYKSYWALKTLAQLQSLIDGVAGKTTPRMKMGSLFRERIGRDCLLLKTSMTRGGSYLRRLLSSTYILYLRCRRS